MQKKIVLIGGPGTGKTSVLKQLKRTGFFCMEEISREKLKGNKKQSLDFLEIQCHHLPALDFLLSLLWRISWD